MHVNDADDPKFAKSWFPRLVDTRRLSLLSPKDPTAFEAKFGHQVLARSSMSMTLEARGSYSTECTDHGRTFASVARCRVPCPMSCLFSSLECFFHYIAWHVGYHIHFTLVENLYPSSIPPQCCVLMTLLGDTQSGYSVC